MAHEHIGHEDLTKDNMQDTNVKGETLWQHLFLIVFTLCETTFVSSHFRSMQNDICFSVDSNDVLWLVLRGIPQIYYDQWLPMMHYDQSLGGYCT